MGYRLVDIGPLLLCVDLRSVLCTLKGRKMIDSFSFLSQ